MGIPMRGLKDIRTLSGSVDRTFVPHKAYMKLACLEMEKVRRGKERQSTVHRTKDIEARFQEIETEEAALLQALQDEQNDDSSTGLDKGAKPVLHEDTRGLKIRY